MTLAQFINKNLDAILAEWEAFALTLQPAAETMTALALRNHAKEILQAMARDIEAAQTDAQQDRDPTVRYPTLGSFHRLRMRDSDAI